MAKYVFYNGSRIKDIRGETFGYLEPLEFLRVENRYAVWRCKCLLCGGYRDISKSLLNSGTDRCEECMKKKVSEEARNRTSPLKGIIKKEKVDLTGKRFGKLVVESLVETINTGNGRVNIYQCKCDCGNVLNVRDHNLIYGSTRSCGCIHRVDLTGQRFGLLTAIKPTGKGNKHKSLIWECKCECGNTVYAPVSRLKNGEVKSCGCIASAEKIAHSKISIAMAGGPKLRKDNISGVTGVGRGNGKWTARIRHQNKVYWLGTYEFKEDAIAVRKAAEKHLYKDFIKWYYENFPNMDQPE